MSNITLGVWIETDFDSTRWLSRFAFLPVRTFDRGYVWLRRYYVRECHYGWGFVDLHPYAELPQERRAA